MIAGRVKRFAAVLAALSIALGPATALAAEETEVERIAAVAFDLAVLRPAGLARFLIGCGLAVIATPFALTSGQGEEMMQQLVGDSAEYTFTRKLGDF